MGLDLGIKHALKLNKKRARVEEHEDAEYDEDDIYTGDSEDGNNYHNMPDVHMTYGGVHVVRKEMIEATIKYLEENPTARSAKCAEQLKKWIKPNNTSLIALSLDYQEISLQSLKPQIFRENDVLGLLRFVNHSDCDDDLSRGETIDLYDLLTKIKPYLPADAEDDDDGDTFYGNLFTFVEKCVELKHGISFH